MNKPAAFDEMALTDGSVRSIYRNVDKWLREAALDRLDLKRLEADTIFRRLGITFSVYTEGGDPERLIPFDIIPRVFGADEWQRLSAGAIQRVKGINAFIHDIYHDQEILRAGKVPAAQVLRNDQFRPEMRNLDVPRDIYAHIVGIDMVRTGENEFYVLEDNARTPSGVAYMLENREVMMRLFPELFASQRIAPVDNYATELLRTLASVAPAYASDPTIAVLTPGIYNSAYFEHAFLAEGMGVELVEGQDLFVENAHVYMRTPAGPKRVDVLYRRLDDDFLDPLAFRPDSALGVPGLMSAYRAGNVNIANAVGTGISDDKSIYTYMPEIIRFYLGEEPILNNVPTYSCRDESDRKYVLEHLPELVVKEVHGSGGYGMLIGPTSTKEQCEEFAKRIKANPDGYIAQPTLALSTCPTFVESGIAPRHVDLRPFVLSGDQVRMVPGGLTRVALPEGSLVVNSSQGGGTKDTWVLEG
ncbi:circularly permuted type 2 ATP-grasp protein [Iodidimonas sp. SYSU 1G8]|uniref:circularly permuted type 2 ATP-grasp protein n=1 Tax=Iodidimonas sp. SYSU 1G8 TaxID=3133967 RepID=UPI0031FF43D0